MPTRHWSRMTRAGQTIVARWVLLLLPRRGWLYDQHQGGRRRLSAQTRLGLESDVHRRVQTVETMTGGADTRRFPPEWDAVSVRLAPQPPRLVSPVRRVPASRSEGP